MYESRTRPGTPEAPASFDVPAPGDGRRRKVVIVESGAGKGGSSRILRYLLPYLDSRVFDPVVVFYERNDGPDTRGIARSGVRVVYLGGRRAARAGEKAPGPAAEPARPVSALRAGARMARRFVLDQALPLVRLVRLIRREQADLVVLNNDVHYHVVGVLAARVTRTPCVCRKAGGIGKGRRIKRILTPWVDVFVAISSATARDQADHNPETRRLVTIHSGIDLARFDPQARHPGLRSVLGIPDAGPVAICIGRLAEGKGQREFLEAAALVARRHRDGTFLVAGDEVDGAGCIVAELEALARALDILEAVRFIGWREDIQAVLSVVDVVVHCPTTWIEGLSVAVLEAMAMGKPTVASDNGGLPDAVEDGVTGFLVPIGDVSAIADRVCRLFDDPALAARLGAAARRRAERDFDIRRNVRRLETVFLEHAKVGQAVGRRR